MSLLGSLSEGLRSLFRKKRVEEELNEELRSFLEMAVEERLSREDYQIVGVVEDSKLYDIRGEITIREPEPLQFRRLNGTCNGYAKEPLTLARGWQLADQRANRQRGFHVSHDTVARADGWEQAELSKCTSARTCLRSDGINGTKLSVYVRSRPRSP